MYMFLIDTRSSTTNHRCSCDSLRKYYAKDGSRSGCGRLRKQSRVRPGLFFEIRGMPVDDDDDDDDDDM